MADFAAKIQTLQDSGSAGQSEIAEIMESARGKMLSKLLHQKSCLEEGRDLAAEGIAKAEKFRLR